MNIDQNEVTKFAELADKWWDKEGDFKPLHKINPLRANYINDIIHVENKEYLDVGCGGGILAEAMFDKGAIVTGIDAAGPGIEIARTHAKENSKNINYIVGTAEDFYKNNNDRFDVVSCLEVLEHVPDPKSLIDVCTKLLKPGGNLFLSTINKNPRSWVTAIVGPHPVYINLSTTLIEVLIFRDLKSLMIQMRNPLNHASLLIQPIITKCIQISKM